MVEVAPRRSLVEEKPFALTRAERTRRLLEELNDAHARHRRDCELYRRICDSSGWGGSHVASRIEDLPFLPAQYFKEAGTRLVSVAGERVYRSMRSSATSGRASTIVLDQATARRQARAVVAALSSFIGGHRRPMLICDVPPGGASSHEISARAAAMMGFRIFASGDAHVLKPGRDGAVKADIDVLRRFTEVPGAELMPVTVIGFTFLLYTALLEPLRDGGRRFALPKGSSIVHIGGWKKLEDRRVDRHQLARAAFDTLGVEADRIFDCYGFTEQMGTVHAECAAGRKHAPVFAEVVVRDPVTWMVLPDGEVGAGQFLSLVPESYPGFSVLTDDLVRVLGRDDCPCGRYGTTFEVLGRHAAAELRGCGDVLAEKVTIAARPMIIASASGLAELERSTPVFADGRPYRSFAGDVVAPEIEDWPVLEQRLRAAQRRLATVRVDDILSLFAAACEEWARPDGPFAPYHPQGLGFVVGFVRNGGLQRAIDASLRGSRGALDAFRPDSIGERRLRAMPLGIVGHWLAGNVPTLGMLSLMLALAAKNANVLKVPREVSPLLPEMLASLGRARHRDAAGRTIDGSVLTDAVVALWHGHDSPDAARMSLTSDARIIWGGAEAVTAIAGLPRRHDCVDVIFGPKLSLAAVGREALAEMDIARRVARGVAVDCSVFDQTACASAHTVFVERGGAIDPAAFARILAEQMARLAERVPHGPLSGRTVGDIKSARMLHFLDGDVLAPASLEWSVLYRDAAERPAPVYGRTVFVRPLDDLAEAAAFVDRNTQVVGLALRGPRRVSVAESLAAAGVDRVTEVGQMTEFAVPWDGIFPLDRLIRWVSLLS